MKLARKIAPGQKVSLKDFDPDEKSGFVDKNDPKAAEQLEADQKVICELQEKLYAESSRGLLVVLQAMDTAGKDGVLRKVVGPLDSRGVHVVTFKAPSSTELAHDYLWRVHAHTPRKGDMVFFNRSHYEDVLVVRVLELVEKARWQRRFDHINDFERMLGDEGITVVKFFLHISKDEQKKRLQERLDDPDKNWKWEDADLKMRGYWDKFQSAYEDVLGKTSTENAPWYVVPANRKWHRDLCVARVLAETLQKMAPKYPHKDIDTKIVIPD